LIPPTIEVKQQEAKPAVSQEFALLEFFDASAGQVVETEGYHY